jgi:hypothetical protein
MPSRKAGSTLVGLNAWLEIHPDLHAGRSTVMRAAVSERYRLSRQRQREIATAHEMK